METGDIKKIELEAALCDCLSDSICLGGILCDSIGIDLPGIWALRFCAGTCDSRQLLQMRG